MVYQPLSPSKFDGACGDSLALTMLDFLSISARMRLRALTFRALLTTGSLLTTAAGGVYDPFTRGKRMVRLLD